MLQEGLVVKMSFKKRAETRLTASRANVLRHAVPDRRTRDVECFIGRLKTGAGNIKEVGWFPTNGVYVATCKER